MMIDRPAAAVAAAAIAPITLPHSVRQRIFLYLGVLIVLLAFGAPSGGLMDIPISFFLKNKLHLKAHEVAEFRLVSAIPLYLSCVFGFIRDTWNPFGMQDRGFMLLFGTISAGLYVFFAFTPITYVTLLVAVVLLTTSFLFVASAQNGLTSMIGQQHAMSGQISAVWNIFASVPTVGALLIGGTLSGLLEDRNADQAARILFLIGAAIMATVAMYAVWKPRSVFDNVRAEHGTAAHPLKDFKRLVRHWPIYPALLIWLLWNFAPGSATPLQYYLQNTLHAEDAQWGQWNAIFGASFIPTFMVFGLLCQRVSLEDPALVGDRRCSSTDGSVALHSFGDRSFDRGCANRPHGRYCHRRLLGPDHSVLPPGPTGDDANDVRRTLFHRLAIWRCSRDKPL